MSLWCRGFHEVLFSLPDGGIDIVEYTNATEYKLVLAVGCFQYETRQPAEFPRALRYRYVCGIVGRPRPAMIAARRFLAGMLHDDSVTLHKIPVLSHNNNFFIAFKI